MQTTLDIDADVLRAAKEMAAARCVSLGVAVSELMQAALTALERAPSRITMNGLRVVPPTGKSATSEMVRRIRECGV